MLIKNASTKKLNIFRSYQHSLPGMNTQYGFHTKAGIIYRLYFVCATTNNLEVEVSGKASNKSEKSENGDEKKLETVSVKSEDKVIGGDIITDGRNISLGLSRSGKESRKLLTLVTLDNSKPILVNVFFGSRECSYAALSSLSVESRVTLDLKTRISEIRNLVRGRRCLVSASRYVELDLGSRVCEGRVSSRSRRCVLSLFCELG